MDMHAQLGHLRRESVDVQGGNLAFSCQLPVSSATVDAAVHISGIPPLQIGS
jgi:hypothetical protein